ncbi:MULTISPECIES: ribonuclease HII [unclassified Apibacter]|uniref:ribonuclease HII n=1 Tax=unclassified Apibacter TaxID=2630820 RepID=UPI00132C6748|nr:MULTISPECIES: ribonuclease HII [unclassified Apibacter]MCX8677404.1 ribonuclease HII [Apibacter sp. B3919]MXO25467.1 ribonuclease HII [Apibacter sp. B3924]MXO26879.1 ribonuclease HII [Apibacter sp. B3813]MXO28551.1 ribonuclease HII [Apibacter sp. B3913]MXO30505.1 ribonuclease HII [Apibacter sp. B3912]
MKLKYSKYKFEVALDEVGRGCLAGPVVAAAVVLPEDFFNEEINDSKQLSERKRKELDSIIRQNAIDYAIAEVSPQKIDEINILNASFLAMHLAVDKLKVQPEFLLVDGNRFHRYKEIPHFCAIKGDANYMNIAAASILAKNHRDFIMDKFHEEFPDYLWKKNKGYPTTAHRQAIKKYGITYLHRKTFKLLDEQLSLNF